MRRSGSSSCMLRPKEESTSDDQLSVTILNTEQLPDYSVERYYMLSEMAEQAPATRFLCDIPRLASVNSNSNSSFAPYCLLYLLWKSDMTSSPNVFVQDVVTKAIQKLQLVVDVVPTTSSSSRPSSPSSLSLSSPSSVPVLVPTSTLDGRLNAHGQPKPRVRLYLVVDRLVASNNNNNNYSSNYINCDDSSTLVAQGVDIPEESRKRRFQVQVELAERLARTVASNSFTRSLCEGITVGVADHERASPGLEACLNAISFGAPTRRRVASLIGSTGGHGGLDEISSNKSNVGLVASSQYDILGPPAAEPDAVEGVLQCRVCAEWSGQGTILSFARRAHAQWRKDRNLPPEDMQRKPSGFNLGELPGDTMTLTEWISSLMIAMFWIAIFVCAWRCYGDAFGAVRVGGSNSGAQ